MVEALVRDIPPLVWEMDAVAAYNSQMGTTLSHWDRLGIDRAHISEVAWQEAEMALGLMPLARDAARAYHEATRPAPRSTDKTPRTP